MQMLSMAGHRSVKTRMADCTQIVALVDRLAGCHKHGVQVAISIEAVTRSIKDDHFVSTPNRTGAERVFCPPSRFSFNHQPAGRRLNRRSLVDKHVEGVVVCNLHPPHAAS